MRNLHVPTILLLIAVVLVALFLYHKFVAGAA